MLSEDEEEAEKHPPKSYGQQFEDVFPYYLSLGMSYDQFWNQDPGLARAYRKAEELRNEKVNQELWMQGMYIYEALCDVAPIMRAFVKRGTKPAPYPSQPHPLKSETERKKERKEKKQMEKARTMMDAFAARVNRNFRKKEGMKDGRTDH